MRHDGLHLLSPCAQPKTRPLLRRYNSAGQSAQNTSALTDPEDAFESLLHKRHTEAPKPSTPLISPDTRLMRSESALSPRRSIFDDTHHGPVALGQVHQMREGTSLGLEGLTRYKTSLNILLIFVPLGVAASILHLDDVLIFCSCFVGMIPLAMHLSRATEDIAEMTNDAFGALVNVTFGNAVEIILSISALRAGRLELIQNTLAGSILSNLLLGKLALLSDLWKTNLFRHYGFTATVLGSAFLWGGIHYPEQTISRAIGEANADMLAFSVFGISVPAIFSMAVPDSQFKRVTEERLSLVTSICLLVLYSLYMFFQLYTHEYLYEEDNGDLESGFIMFTPIAEEDEEDVELNGEGDATERQPSLFMSFTILVVIVIFVAVLSGLLVDTFEEFSKKAGLSEKFVAIVLLPVIGNAVEHISAILVAGHNKIDLSIGIACGSSVQIALFAAPVMVVISWFLGGAKLTLNFRMFETVCMGFSVFVVNATLRDSRSNWLEGAVLVTCYIISAAAFYFMV